MSALHTGRLYPTREISGAHFCQKLSRYQGHSATEKVKSVKNVKDPSGYQTQDIPACSVVRQQTAPPRTITRVK